MNNEDQETKAAYKEDDYEEEEDALSLCDFPITAERNNDSSITHHRRRSSSEYAFEFSSDSYSDYIYMSHAEDIIHCGKLVPYIQHQQPHFDHQISKSLSEDYDSGDFSRRYCDSSPTRSNSSASTRLTRSSRSLDRGRLRRNSSLVMKSEASDSHRSVSRGLVKSEASKPWWYGLMFGIVKLPSEMDLRDMRNRQVRRSPGRILPAVDGCQSDRRSSWGHDLLRVLSCKNHSSSVAVTASIGLVPQL